MDPLLYLFRKLTRRATWCTTERGDAEFPFKILAPVRGTDVSVRLIESFVLA